MSVRAAESYSALQDPMGKSKATRMSLASVGEVKFDGAGSARYLARRR